jgi:hypothetical protein
MVKHDETKGAKVFGYGYGARTMVKYIHSLLAYEGGFP